MEKIGNGQGKWVTSYVDCAYSCPKCWALRQLDHHPANDSCWSVDPTTHLALPRPSCLFRDKAIS
jgi:hypothetical protein